MAATTGAKQRRERYSTEMRQDILRAARAIIANEGAGALSIRGIARELGYSAPALYEYFASKEAIAEALFVAGFDQLRAALEQVEQVVDEPLARLAALARAYRQFALAHPAEYGLMFGRPIPQFQPTEELLFAAAAPAFAPLQRATAAAIAASALPPQQARTAATIDWATMHGLVSLELARMGGPPWDLPPEVVAPAAIPDIYDEALRAILRGLGATDGATNPSG